MSGQPASNQRQIDLRALEIATESRQMSADTKQMWQVHVEECVKDRILRAERDRALTAAITKVATDVSDQTKSVMRWAIGLLIAAVAYFLITVGLPGSQRDTDELIPQIRGQSGQFGATGRGAP